MALSRWHLLLWSSLKRRWGLGVRGLICASYCSKRLASAFSLTACKWNILFSSCAWHVAVSLFFGRQDCSADFDSDNPDGWFLAAAALICGLDILPNPNRSDLLLSWAVCHSWDLKTLGWLPFQDEELKLINSSIHWPVYWPIPP